MKGLFLICFFGSAAQALVVQDGPNFIMNKPAPKKRVPVVYVWLGNAPMPDSMGQCVMASLKKNEVIILKHSKVKGPEATRHIDRGLTYVHIDQYLAKDTDFFGTATAGSKNSSQTDRTGMYRHWGVKEPYEESNVQRAFVLNEYMKGDGKKYDHVWFADGDVAAMANMTKVYYEYFSKCGAAFDLDQHQEHSSGRWSAWIGSSFLSQKILSEFRQFTKKLYSEKHIEVLKFKKENHPFVSDMTLWYLLAVAAGRYPTADAMKEHHLPQVNITSAELCDTNTRSLFNQGHVKGHFDRMHGYDLKNYKMDVSTGTAMLVNGAATKQLWSLHFQGQHQDRAANELPQYYLPENVHD